MYLIGAGPGDIEMLTLKAMKRLQECDVILIDDLANPDVLQFSKENAQIINVGKRGGSKHTEQREIVDKMIAFAKRGLVVGRLKGGDPFIFGRGGEELLAVQAANIECEIISGITAGIAVPASIGIPLSHRQYSSGITMITGHSCAEGNLNWSAIAESKTTIVIYMGMLRASQISAKLCQCGMAPDTPCAIIENGTLPNQRSVITKLADLSNAIKDHGLGSPSIIVIGDVVSLAAPTSVLSPLETLGQSTNDAARPKLRSEENSKLDETQPDEVADGRLSKALMLPGGRRE